MDKLAAEEAGLKEEMEIHIRIAQKTYGKQKESKAALEAATKAQDNKAMEEARVMLKSMTDELKK